MTFPRTDFHINTNSPTIRLCAAIAACAALGVGLAVPVTSVQAQTSAKDTLYDARTQPQGSCPAMDWHVVVHPDKSVNGVIGWDNFKHIAHIATTLDGHGAFKANATEQGGASHSVNGTVDPKAIRADISGAGCDHETLAVPRSANGISNS